MTDLNERLAAMLENEPAARDDLDRVLANGRRALRRRTTLTALAGTAGTAAITAAVVVPIVTQGHRTPTDRITLGTQPTAEPKCKLYYEAGPDGEQSTKHRLTKALERARAQAEPGEEINVASKSGAIIIEMCPPGAVTSSGETAAPDPTATMPAYHYSADPQAIANGFESELGHQVNRLGFTIIYSRPFAQESSALEKGHPTYYDGNVDVQLPDGPADIGVQVNHSVTQLVPFDGDCNAPTCERTTLDDGSLLQVSHIDAGSGGAEVIAVEIHYADGLVVQAQESNYGFGPEAGKGRSSQPLTIKQLTELAHDPAWAF